MGDRHLVAIDVGVSFVKAGVYDERGGKKAGASRPVHTLQPEPGTFSQDPDEMYDLVRDALREAVSASGVGGKSVAAIAVSGAMGGAMGVDEHWRPTTDWSIISDSRFMPHAVEMQEGAGQAILEQSGTNVPVMGAKIIWWRKGFPEAYARTAKFVVIGGYIAARLGGIGIEDAFIDRTYLNFTGIANLSRDEWSKEICGQFGIDRKRLPRVVASNAVIGRLTPESAIECGLVEGTPIVAGAGDKSAGTLGAGLVRPGLVVDEAASFGALSLCVDRYVPDAKYRTLENLPSPVPGLFVPSLFLNGSGITHAWFADTFGGEEKREAAERGGSAYDLLAARAAKVPPGSEGLIAIGHLGGRTWPSDPSIRGMWLGQSWVHGKEHFYRALLESFAYEYATVLSIMRENYPEMSFEEIRVIGGGARSDLWNQVKADVLGIRYVRLARDDYAMLGDLLLAGSAVGIFADPAQDAARFAGSDRAYEPDLRKTAYYARYVDIYRGLFDRERPVFKSLQEIPPWGEKTRT